MPAMSSESRSNGLLAANYASGSVVAFPIRADGALGEPGSFTVLTEDMTASQGSPLTSRPGTSYRSSTSLCSGELRGILSSIPVTGFCSRLIKIPMISSSLVSNRRGDGFRPGILLSPFPTPLAF